MAGSLDKNSRSGYIQIKDLVVFLLGLSLHIKIYFVGVFNMPEIVAIILAPYAFFFKKGGLRKKIVLPVLSLAFLWLISQIFVDIYRSTSAYDASRGAANIFVFIADLCLLSWLCFGNFRRQLLFVLGLLVSHSIYVFVSPDLNSQYEPWKFAVGPWANMSIMAFLGIVIIQVRSKLVKILCFLGCVLLMGLNFYLGARSLGLIVFLSTLVLFIPRSSKLSKGQSLIKKFSSGKTIVLFTFVCLSTWGLYSIYGLLALDGHLGSKAQYKFEKQSSGSFGILLGARQEVLVSSLAIADSPIIGHGSWAKNPEYLALLSVILKDFEYEAHPVSVRGDDTGLIPTHSYLFSGWVYAGIFGALFWFYMLMITFRAIRQVAFLHSPWSLFLMTILIGFLWDIFFSPLGLYSRIYAAFMIVVALSVQSSNVVTNRSGKEIGAGFV